MTKVRFSSETSTKRRDPRTKQVSKMALFIMNNSGGLIKDAKTANAVLLAAGVLFLLITLYMFSRTGNVTNENVSDEVYVSPTESVGQY